ncbi:ABC transporter ATP-binding protein [Quadrisphaera setariae]|uniref:Dipeptide ABC transporter ATP-binding protein n=1 Tax=Quadrisphaera setariae TaxID=2593304 RepID=A0A5C8Z2X3_9ACTN|nr:ABC transporter ATP-binding protein [Quadrisphaera setariae]TXR51598.1 dipeptide ABC transporter ATP-binding protein [Quadrisphaera setariae]
MTATATTTSRPGSTPPPLLEVEDLTVRYAPKLGAPLTAVDHVSLTLREGEFVGLVGESGSGKSTLGTALLQLLQPPAQVLSGSVRLDGEDLLAMDDDDLRVKRWRDVSTVFQSSMNCLNPVLKVRTAFVDAIRTHTGASRDEALARARELAEMVAVDPKVLDGYAHELSGGMRQRVNLALALALKPRFVLLDEPTTGLDVVVQRTILDGVRRLQAEQRFTVLFISHDMGTVLETSDRVAVMYAGRLVEVAPSADLVRRPEHPYSRALLGSYGDPRAQEVSVTYLPGRPPDLAERPAGCAFASRCPEAVSACRELDPPLEPVGASLAACLVASGAHGQGPLAGAVGQRPDGFAGPAFTKAGAASSTREGEPAEPVVEVSGVTRTFVRRDGRRRTALTAVKDASFVLRRGAVTALVGESGSGKSTLARMVSGGLAPTSGSLTYHPQEGAPADLASLRGATAKAFRRDVQYVFQDPYAALNPAHTIGQSLEVPLRSFERLRGRALRERSRELLEQVGLPGDFADRYPHQLSGGQRQRVVIARSLAPDPRLLVADEPIASLDVSIRAEVLELLDSLVRERGVGILYITHDLLSARLLADEVLVLNKGEVVERGPALQVITRPQHAYTKTLLAAVADPTGARSA